MIIDAAGSFYAIYCHGRNCDLPKLYSLAKVLYLEVLAGYKHQITIFSRFHQVTCTVDNIVEKHSRSLDAIINKMKKNMATMTVKELNDTSLELAIETFYFAE